MTILPCGFKGTAWARPLARRCLLLAATFTTLGSAAATDWRPHMPHPNGIVAVIRNDPSEPLDPVPFQRGYVRGIALQILWSDIEPTRSHPDWKHLDELFEQARASHKWIQLLVFAGFFSPSWALDGAQTDMFKIQYGPGKGMNAKLPMPWDPVYRRNWYEFVRLLADRYGRRPELRIIAAGGPTSVTVEATLPDRKPEVAEWIADGYRPWKYLAAWQEAFDEFSCDFPRQYVSLSHGDGLPINEQGDYDTSEIVSTSLAVEDEGYRALGERFTFQSSALTGKPRFLTTPAFEQVMSYVGKSQTGFQAATSCEKGFKKMGGANPRQAMQNSLDNAASVNSVGCHVNYFEVQAEDIDSPDLQSMLEMAGTLFDPRRP